MSALARRDLIDGSNLQPSLVQRFSDLLGQQLGFFGCDLDVRMSLEERANRRGDDGIHLVRIIHSLHAKLRMTSPDRQCVSLHRNSPLRLDDLNLFEGRGRILGITLLNGQLLDLHFLLYGR